MWFNKLSGKKPYVYLLMWFKKNLCATYMSYMVQKKTYVQLKCLMWFKKTLYALYGSKKHFTKPKDKFSFVILFLHFYQLF